MNEVDIVVSGHSHSVLNDPVLIEGRPVVQTGAELAYMGHLQCAYSDRQFRFDRFDLKEINDQILGRQAG